ncbi:dihydrofolate reductase [Erpetoichthys calabaricus]|uniref:dihydrofolate reductase n=1 Tax=Erpetoichthys calabaricus TaxID=27687 RepID=A0A8C4S280_ERPCA|nr:dihydrofolate reductase [Erpetoichthys calabaricus]
MISHETVRDYVRIWRFVRKKAEIRRRACTISKLATSVKINENSMGRLLKCIVAVCPNMGIGKNGNLPWHPTRLSNEFKHFQKMTMTPSSEGRQNVVIMGRKTWFSIPERNRPLKNRINIVLSRELQEPPQGAHYVADSLTSALSLLESSELSTKVDEVWVIGGSSLYKEVMETASEHYLFVTRILQEFECDTFLPDIKVDQYRLLPEFPGISDEIQEENGIKYKFEVYKRIVQ